MTTTEASIDVARNTSCRETTTVSLVLASLTLAISLSVQSELDFVVFKLRSLKGLSTTGSLLTVHSFFREHPKILISIHLLLLIGSQVVEATGPGDKSRHSCPSCSGGPWCILRPEKIPPLQWLLGFPRGLPTQKTSKGRSKRHFDVWTSSTDCFRCEGAAALVWAPNGMMELLTRSLKLNPVTLQRKPI